jgi:outer membrane protein insertion porin family
VEKVELVGVDLPAKSALSAIVIEGNKTIETKEILKLIKSQTGQPLDLKQVKEDVRSLISRRWFFHVETRVAESNDGPVLIFRVTEKPSQDQAP